MYLRHGAVDDPVKHDPRKTCIYFSIHVQSIDDSIFPVLKTPSAINDPAKHDPGKFLRFNHRWVRTFFSKGVKLDVSETASKLPGAVNDPTKHDPGIGKQEIVVFLQGVKPDVSETVSKLPSAVDDPTKHDPGKFPRFNHG